MSVPIKENGEPVTTDKEIEDIINVQNLLTQNKTKTAEKICEEISAIMDIKQPENASFIAREIITTYIDPIQDPDVVLKIIKIFCQKSNIIKSYVMKILKTPISDTRIKVFHFKILRALLVERIFDFDDILDVIEKYPLEYQNQYLAIFTFFASFIDKRDHKKFTEILKIIRGFKDLSPLYFDMLRMLTQISENRSGPKFKRWFPLDRLCEKGYAEEEEVGSMFTERNFEKVSNTIADGFGSEKYVPLSPFFPSEHFLDSPKVTLLAAYFGLEKIFIKVGYAEIDAADNKGIHVPYYAACGGNIPIMETILKVGGYEGKEDKNKKSYFTQTEDIELVPPITRDLGFVGMNASGASNSRAVKKRVNDGLLAAAAKERRLDAMKWIVENLALVPSDYTEALVAAAKSNFLAGIQYLLSIGVDVNGRSFYSENTALHAACLNGSLEAVKLLLSTKGVNINAKNDKAQTIVHAAAYGKNKPILELVCSLSGIVKNSVDIYANTPETIWHY